MRRLFAYLFLSAMLAPSVSAKVIVNEVMSNEPSGYTGLEWFELYNDGIGIARLSFYQIDVNGTLLSLNDSVLPQSYLIICRKLVGIPANPGFENWWGNGSGVWGDTPQENYRVIEATFGLTNASGTITTTFLGTLESSFSWSSAGGDGISWERMAPNSATIGQCLAPSGSTPGTANSLALSARDLALDSIEVSFQSGVTSLTFLISSRSYAPVSGASLLIYYVDPLDSTNTSQSIESVDLPAVDTGFTTAVVRELTIPGTYADIGGLLSADDRAYNNRRTRVVPAQHFPPIVLSEFLANPDGGLATEWVELYNREDSAVSLSGWKLGDSAGLSSSIGAISIPAKSYLVVAKDTSAFRLFYSSFQGELTTVPNFPSLNNAGDIVRLLDRYGYIADQFAYSDVYPDNVTWGKSLLDNRWGKSTESGGSPGKPNDLRFEPSATALRVAVEPQIFSPDHDGVDDSVLIKIDAPKAKSYTVRIYNSDGRLVRTFENKSGDLADAYVWDGRDQSGGRLSLGLYIIYVEAVGVESVKKTVVVAR